MLLCLQMSAQTLQRGHGKISHLKKIREHKVDGGIMRTVVMQGDTLTLNVFDGKVKGQHLRQGEKYSTKVIYYNSANDSIVKAVVLTSSLICDYIEPLTSNIVPSNIIVPTPKWNSLPSATHSLYLNFDGWHGINLNWSPNYINALPSTMSLIQKKQIFDSVAFYNSAFNVNVTTDSNVYKATNNTEMIVITPTWQFYGVAVGGVYYVGCYKLKNYMPGWAFESNLAYEPKYIARAVCHELWHGLGLGHQPQYRSDCTVLYQYNNGNANSGPIMGDPYDSKFAQADSSSKQNDLPILLNNGFGYRVKLTIKSLQAIGGAFVDSGYILSGDTNTFLIPAGLTVATIKISTGQFTWKVMGNKLLVFANPAAVFKDYCYSVSPNYLIGSYKISGVFSGTPPNPCANFSISVTPKNSSICQNLSMKLSASPAQSYVWLASFGLSLSPLSAVTITPTITTTYTVTGTNAQGCTAQATAVVTVLPNPTITITASKPNPICKNSPVTLSAIGVITWVWQSPLSSLSSTVSVSPVSSTSYSVIGTDNNGCTGTSSYAVTVKDCLIPVNQALSNVKVNSAIIGFSKNGSTDYVLTISPTVTVPKVSCTTACTFVLTGLTKGTHYTYSINGGKVFNFTTPLK